MNPLIETLLAVVVFWVAFKVMDKTGIWCLSVGHSWSTVMTEEHFLRTCSRCGQERIETFND